MFDVVISNVAQNEMQSAYDWWAINRSREEADRWYNELLQKILTLENDPDRLGLADENDSFPIEIRQLNFGVGSRPTHRAVFTIRAKRVVVLRIRHLAQAPLTP